MSKRAIIFLGFAVLTTVFMTRTLGIHIDENNYLGAAHSLPLGDSATTGKPYVFYFLNYAIFNTVGHLLGPLRPLSLYFVYLALWVVSLGWTASKLAPRQDGFVSAFFLLLLSPLCILNSTQIMMENPILPLLTITFGAAIAPIPRKKRNAALFASALAAMLLKETAIAAVVALAIAFRAWALFAAIGIALVSRFLLLAIIGAPLLHYDGKLSNIFSIDIVFDRATNLFTYLWLWIFFVSIPGTAGAVYYFRNRRPDARPIFEVAAFSLAAVLALMCLTNEDFARYCYPSLWIGALAVTWLALRLPKKVTASMLATSVILAANLWDFGSARLALWPTMVSRELYYSGYTILPGVALHAWEAFAFDRRKNMCVFLYQNEAEKAWAIARYLSHITENPRLFTEGNSAAFALCDGPKAVFRRQYQMGHQECSPECPNQQYSIANCTHQEMQGWATHPGRSVINRTCLP